MTSEGTEAYNGVSEGSELEPLETDARVDLSLTMLDQRVNTSVPEVAPQVRSRLAEVTQEVEEQRTPLHQLPNEIGKVFEDFSLEKVFELIQKIMGMFSGKESLNPERVDAEVGNVVEQLEPGEKARTALALEKNEAPDPHGNPNARYVALQTQNRMRSPYLSEGYRSGELVADQFVQVQAGDSLEDVVGRMNPGADFDAEAHIQEMRKMGILLPNDPIEQDGYLHFGSHPEGKTEAVYLVGFAETKEPLLTCRAFLPGYEALDTGYKQFTAHLEHGDMVMDCTSTGIGNVISNAQGGFPAVHIAVWDAYANDGAGAFVHMHNGDGFLGIGGNGGGDGIVSQDMQTYLSHRQRLNQGPVSMMVLESPFRDEEEREAFVNTLRGQIGSEDYSDRQALGAGMSLAGINPNLVDRLDGNARVCTSFVHDGIVESNGSPISDRVPTLVDFYMNYRVKWQGDVVLPA